MKKRHMIGTIAFGIASLMGFSEKYQNQESQPEIRQTIQQTSEETKARLSELIKQVLKLQKEFSRAKYQQNKIKDLEQMAKHLTSAKAKAEEIAKRIDISLPYSLLIFFDIKWVNSFVVNHKLSWGQWLQVINNSVRLKAVKLLHLEHSYTPEASTSAPVLYELFNPFR